MPCYTVQEMSVEFRAAHADLLEKAMSALGWRFDKVAAELYRLQNGIELNLLTGKATIRAGQQDKLNELKRQYSAEAIKRLAAKNRWTVSKTTATKGKFIRTYM